MTGAISESVEVSLSMESVSSESPSSATTSRANPSVTSFQDALRLLGLLEQLGNLRERGDFDAQLLVEQQGQFVDQVEVPRIRQGDVERAVLRVQRHEVVAEHQIHRNGAEKIVIDPRFPQIRYTRSGSARQSPVPVAAPPRAPLILSLSVVAIHFNSFLIEIVSAREDRQVQARSIQMPQSRPSRS